MTLLKFLLPSLRHCFSFTLELNQHGYASACRYIRSSFPAKGNAAVIGPTYIAPSRHGLCSLRVGCSVGGFNLHHWAGLFSPAPLYLNTTLTITAIKHPCAKDAFDVTQIAGLAAHEEGASDLALLPNGNPGVGHTLGRTDRSPFSQKCFRETGGGISNVAVKARVNQIRSSRTLPLSKRTGSLQDIVEAF